MTDAEWRAERMKEEAEIAAIIKRQEDGEGIIAVFFEHDLEDGWYVARFPDHSLNGSYALSASIQKIAIDRGWAKEWVGDQQYNPWKTK